MSVVARAVSNLPSRAIRQNSSHLCDVSAPAVEASREILAANSVEG
ncbi:hypothetical protein ACNKHM_08160 [Shigella sonnei]